MKEKIAENQIEPENKNIKAEQVEKKEQKEFPIIRMWMIDEGDPYFLAMKQVLSLFLPHIDMKLIKDSDQLIKALEDSKADPPDLIFMGMLKEPYFQTWEFKGVPEFITKIRNNSNIKKQPVILRASFLKEGLKAASKAGADLAIRQPISLVDLLKSIHSVPELLGQIEDNYGDRMLKNKQGFYKEYADKLAARSEMTADIEKELDILEDVFKKNRVKKVLDAGGGEGRIAIPLTEKGYQVTNADSSHELLEKMKQKNDRVEAIETDLRKLPIDKEQYDAVTYNWHVFSDILGNKSKQRVLNEAYRVLKNGGVIVLDLPDRAKGAYEVDGVYIRSYGGENIFVGYTPSEEEMVEYLEQAGFKNIKVTKWETKNGFPKITFIAKKLRGLKENKDV